MAFRSENVRDDDQRPVSQARVYVFNHDDNQLADLTSQAGDHIDNPLITGESGEYSYSVPDGLYNEQVVFGGRLRRIENKVQVGTFILEGQVVDINNILGVDIADGDLGAFTGNVIPDDVSVKEALQALETDAALEVWAERFMTLPAVGDQTAAFQAAIDSLPANGGSVRFNGDYIVGATNPIRFPAEPKTVYLYGEGGSILRQGAANAPMIAKVAGVSRVIGAHMKGFTVIAHVDSLKATATNILVNIAGFDWSEIDIQYKSNSVFTSTTGRAYAVIAGHANGIPCYNNKIRLEMQQTNGPEKGVWLHNNSAITSLANANANKVTIWAYEVSECTYLVDVADSTFTIVDFGLAESCRDSIAVRMGNYTKLCNKWPENVLAVAEFSQTSTTTANNCILDYVYLSGNGTFIIADTIGAPVRFNDVLFSGATHFIKSIAARVTGTIAGTVLTVTSVQSGTIAVGHSVGNALTGTTITSPGTGTGGVGTYNLSTANTFASPTTFVLGVPTLNYVTPTVAKAQPAAPSVSFALGGGALSGNSASVRHRVDHHAVTTFEASYIVTAPVVGRSVFRFAPPSGFEIEQASVAAAATGAAPIFGALSAAATGTDYEIWFPTTADHVIYTRVTLRATFP